MMNRFPLIVLVVAGCASAGTASSSTGAAASARDLRPDSVPACATGIVGVEGPGIAPRTTLRGPDGSTTLLEGPEARRVRLLTGAVVTACGQAAGAGWPLVVETFDLRQVDGMEAYLGSLRRQPGRAELDPADGGVPIPLGGAVDRIPAEAPMLWVAGRWAGDRFEVLSFGVLTGW